MRVQGHEWDVHHREQSELLDQGRSGRQESLHGGDHHPGPQVSCCTNSLSLIFSLSFSKCVKTVTTHVFDSNVVDDEEEMLYGDSNACTTPSKDDLNRSFGQTAFGEGSSNKAEPSHWCMIIRENGVMEVREGNRASLIIQLHLNILSFLPPLSRFISYQSGAWCSW